MVESAISSYGKIYNLGHRELDPLLDDPVVIQEKVDGSQFSAFVDKAGELHMRSRGAVLRKGNATKQFDVSVATAVALHEKGLLVPGWTYRGESVCRPKHNTLAYERIPLGGWILFDVDKGDQHYTDPEELAYIAESMGLEAVPTLFRGKLERGEEGLKVFNELLERASCLGGQKVEGVVIKNYARFDRAGKALMGKHVSEAYKEVHAHDWRKRNPSGGDVIEDLGQQYCTQARWRKAIERARDAGTLLEEPKDIGLLIRAIIADVLEECEDEIKARLFSWAWPKVSRMVTRGFPEWYKERLLSRQFELPDSGNEGDSGN